jgi:hypothetical protein
MDYMYYLLGFFWADGSLDNYSRITVKLSTKNIEHLRNIGKFFNINVTESTITNRKTEKKYKICVLIVNKKLSKWFVDNGIIQRKTYENNSLIFDKLTSQQKKMFLLGYFDGDGSVFKSKSRKTYKYNVSFVGLNLKLLESISVFLKENAGITATPNKDGKYYRLVISGNNSVKNFREFIYDNVSFKYLERKYKILSECDVHTPRGYYYHKQTNRYRITLKKYKEKYSSKELYFQNEEDTINFLNTH